MLLNEFLKAHRKLERQEATITQLKSADAKQAASMAQQQKRFESAIAQQQNEIQALTASLKEQAAQIRKVSNAIKLITPAPRVVTNQ